jgi:hypothetical protein
MMKTSELTGVALDWAVAKCEGRSEPEVVNNFAVAWYTWGNTHYSTDWAQGGPIIEREHMGVRFDFEEDEWQAIAGDFDDWVYGWGETPLIAAMRCYVASKLGDEVEVPEELK